MSRLLLDGLCLAGCAALAAGTIGAAWAAATSRRVRTAIDAHRASLALELRRAGLRADAATWLAVQAWTVGATVLLALAFRSVAMLALLVPVLLLPLAWLRRARSRRVTRIDAQIDGWLVLLSNALKATPALAEAVASTVSLVEPPLREELDIVSKAQRLGTPLDGALDDMSDRVGSRVLQSAIVALRIARRTGGDLHRTLESSAASLRELARVESVVRSRTAEGRAQSMLVAVLPAPMLLVLELLDPSFLAPLFASTRGHLVLAAAAVLWCVAVLWARRIVAVDV